MVARPFQADICPTEKLNKMIRMNNRILGTEKLVKMVFL